MSVCGQLGTGAGSLFIGPPVHWADLCQGPRVRAVISVRGWKLVKTDQGPCRDGNALKYKWGWIFIFLPLWLKKVLSIYILNMSVTLSSTIGTLSLPINAALGFICYYPQVLFLPKVGVTLSSENSTLEALLLLQFSHLVNVSEREKRERARKTYNEAHSEVR